MIGVTPARVRTGLTGRTAGAWSDFDQNEARTAIAVDDSHPTERKCARPVKGGDHEVEAVSAGHFPPPVGLYIAPEKQGIGRQPVPVARDEPIDVSPPDPGEVPLLSSCLHGHERIAR